MSSLGQHSRDNLANRVFAQNVELSPARPDIYFIEPAVGKVAYHVPDSWFPHMREHFQDQYRLDYDSTDRTPISMAKPAANSRPGTGGGPGQPPASRPSSAFRGRGRDRGTGRGGGVGGWSSNLTQQHTPPPGPPPGYPHSNPSLPQGQWGPPPQQPIYQYANDTQTSGAMQRRRPSSGAGWQIATEVIKVTPALIGTGVQIAMLTGGCVVM